MKLGFIGTGNMAGAILSGICEAGAFPAGEIAAFDIDTAKTRALNEKYGVLQAESAKWLAADADVILLGLKPQQAQAALGDIGGLLTEKKTLVSIVTGLSVSRMQALTAGCGIVRVMPNTPALCGKGVFVVSDNSDRQVAPVIKDLLGQLGDVLTLPEALFPAATAVTGSGPAYVFMFLEGMVHAATQMGIEEAVARAMACKTLVGAAALAQNSPETLLKLRQNVCSPGGTTIEGVRVLEESDSVAAISRAFDAAYRRAEELEQK